MASKPLLLDKVNPHGSQEGLLSHSLSVLTLQENTKDTWPGSASPMALIMSSGTVSGEL
jgi:hypothetical protein